MDDLVREFVEETSDSLAALDNEIVRLESNPDDEELVGNIFRLLHTIKGTCGFLGLPRLASVAHAAENVLGKIREKQMRAGPESVSLILAAFDRIKSLMDHLVSEGAEPAGDDSALIHQLDACAGMTGGHDAPPAAAHVAGEIAPTASQHELDELERLFNSTEVDEEFFEKNDIEAMAEKLRQEAREEEKKVEPVEVPKPAAPAAAAAAADDHKAVGGAAAAANAAAGGGQSIRVSLEVLERLMETVSELVLTRNQLAQIARVRDDSDFLLPIQRLGRITAELQDDVMKTRMQAISNAWAKFPRLIRDLSMELGKKINLQMFGEETELDRQLLEMIKDPLTHMVRNSVDHGLEKPEERKAAGKPEEGTVSLRAYHEGGHIIIEIQDDGRGLNVGRIREKAVEKGVASESEVAEMSDQRVMQFIFAAGFSTAEKVTAVSGRGVGMDVVRSNIEKIGGSIELFSTQGKGTTFKIKIPLTLAIVSVLIVGAGTQRFALPQINVSELVYASSKSEYRIETINEMPVMRLRDHLIPLMRLSEVMGILGAPAPTGGDGTYIVVCSVAGFDFGLVVDRVYDTEEIVVKPVSHLLQSVDLYGGCTILGDGGVILILDPNGLARRTGDVHIEQESHGAARKMTQSFADMPIRFLVFNAGDDTPKAVPLELVARLEEIEATKIEHSSGLSVVQYRDTLMVLIGLHDQNIGEPKEGLYTVVVFNYEGRMVGLVIRNIIDIVDARLELKVSSQDPTLIGSMVISGHTTDVIDTGYVISRALGEMKASSDMGENTQQKKRKRTILFVDDSAFFRNLSAPYLSAQGFEVLTADGPPNAFKMLENYPDPVDLIISDIEMPDVNGVEFAKQCQADARYKEIPMIAYTSTMTTEAIQKGLAAGFKAYVSKTDRDGLVREVGTILS